MIYLAIPFAIAAAVIVADWLDWHGTLGPAWLLRLPARLVMPHTGHHRDKYATDTPAPEQRPGQARRPGDPHAPTCAVRGAATSPAPRGAARAGQAPGPAASGSPPWQPAPLPQPEAGASPASASPGLGQPFDGHREPWYVTIGERTPPGRLLAVGYDPFDTGPRAIIPDPYVSLRATGAHAAIPDAAPLVSRRMLAHEAHVDKAVNQ